MISQTSCVVRRCIIFWSKCEWETVIYPWVGDEKAAKKIDVFWQLQNNWDRFIEYLWDMSEKNER